MATVEINVGMGEEMAEFGPAVCFSSVRPCKHATPDSEQEGYWHCKRVVTIYNEGGHNGTEMCLDCLLDELESLGVPLSGDRDLPVLGGG